MIKYKFDISYQINRYLDVLKRISIGFNQERRLYLLDWLPEKSRDRVTLLPIYEKHLNEIKQINDFTNIDFLSDELKGDILSSAKQGYKKYRIHFVRIEKEWHIHKDSFEDLFYRQFPTLTNIEITLSPTIFETVGSYNIQDEQLQVFPRFDRSISQIVHLIVNAATHFTQFPHKYLTGDMWYQKQTTVQKNISTGGYEELTNQYKSLIKIISDHTVGNLVKESITNYLSLGYPVKSVLHDINKLENLTNTELQILQELIVKKPDVLTFDEIAVIIWGSQWIEKYSLYALTKAMQRIRVKLRLNNIHQNIIHTQRGQGYVLFD